MVKQIIIILTTFAILASAQPAMAQQAGKVYRIGYLANYRVNPVFRQRLSELGYVEGKNLTIELRALYRDGKRTVANRLALAKELVRLKVDLILSLGTGKTRGNLPR